MRTERPRLARYHWERADARQSDARDSEPLLVSVAGARAGQPIICLLEHHFFLANRERFGARFDLLRPLFLDNDLLFRRFR